MAGETILEGGLPTLGRRLALRDKRQVSKAVTDSYIYETPHRDLLNQP